MDCKKKRLESELRAAVYNEDLSSVKLLLSRGAKPDLVGRKGVAAIHLAVGKETEKNVRCLKMLLAHGADPNIRSSEGLTPIHIAALWGCYQNLRLLLINGGNPNTKDDDGNTPINLAEQQDNKKCAHLLREYQTSSLNTEEDEPPKFQYCVYPDQKDTSSYPESDCTFSSQASLISDFGEVPLSSTRCSSFFNQSHNDGKANCSGILSHRLSGSSFLSSTRMSTVEPAANMSALKQDVLCSGERFFTTKASEETHTAEGAEPLKHSDFCSKQTNRKSVSFKDADECFPVFSPTFSKPHLKSEQHQDSGTLPFDMSEYSDFLDSQRLATILPMQGIDVTSPDHVYVFCRESSESTEEDMEKTVINHCTLEVSDDEPEEEMKKPEKNRSKEPVRSCVNGSGSSGSNYSSCDSDLYTSAVDVSTRTGKPLCGKTESNEKNKVSSDSNMPTDHPVVQEASKTEEPVPAMLDKLHLREDKDSNIDGLESCSDPDADVCKFVAGTLGDIDGFTFTPSPFVTGRTKSRLSRCSMRTSQTPESFLQTSSVFDDSLPTPVRTLRHIPRIQSSGSPYFSPRALPYRSKYLGNDEGSSNGLDDVETQTCTLPAASGVSSQPDTLILPRSPADSAAESQSLSDTVLLEKSQGDSDHAYEKSLAEIILAIKQKKDGADSERLNAGRNAVETGMEETGEKSQCARINTNETWMTEDASSQSDSTSSSSSSSYFSPKKSREGSVISCVPGTGCTPRYSMSRLSAGRHLADLSHTPGGRPTIQDQDEPVEYLYTDTEQGHELIETHVPPTADTSLSSGLSTTSSEDTILYDWRSLQAELKNSAKDNQQLQTAPQKQANVFEDDLLPETRGITDRELRLRLVELGESPGPISSHTRPTYMRRLCRLLQETNYQPPHDQKPLAQPQTDFSYSPELCRVLQTFKLPECQADEQTLCLQFDQPDQNRKWREGIIKSSFNYLLLDPRVTKNLPFRSHTIALHECFRTFIHAIFYVGKGKRSRPYSHLYEALEYHKGDKTAKRLCPKVKHILEVWKAGQGVISLHCFQNVIPVEAYTREACMVEAIGLKMLTNQKRGDFYGVVSSWQQKRKRELGIHLLYRAMQIFLAEGERQLRPADIRQ